MFKRKSSALLILLPLLLFVLLNILSIQINKSLYGNTLTRDRQHEELLPVCILGNAETVSSAVAAARQWPTFPVFFSVWGEHLDSQIVKHGRVYCIPAPESTHASGWEMALVQAKLHAKCNYYFTLDDDLQWHLDEVGKQFYIDTIKRKLKLSGTVPHRHGGYQKLSLSSVLSQFLQLYQPAVVVFPWPWADEHYENSQKINRKFANQIAQPATSFDNGCLIFHHSIVDFFIPLWLGNHFTAKFIAQHSFLNYFVPYLFQQHALRLNGIWFVNPPKQRHAYDDDSSFSKYLNNGMRCKTFGMNLKLEQVWWANASVLPAGKAEYSIDALFLGSIYNLTHSIITGNQYIKYRHEYKELQRIDSIYEDKSLWCNKRVL